MHYASVGNTPFSNPVESAIPRLGDESSVIRSLNADMHDGTRTDYYIYIWHNDNYVLQVDVMAISEKIMEAEVRKLVDRMQAHYVR